MRTEENEEKGVACNGVGKALENERGEFAFHGLTGFDVEGGIAKEAVFRLLNRFFLGIRAEFPVNIDQIGLRKVFEWRDDAVAELTRRGLLDL